MKLSISLAAAAVLLRFTTPGPGNYYVFTVVTKRAEIVASGYVTNACHVAFKLPIGQASALYQTAFFPENFE